MACEMRLRGQIAAVRLKLTMEGVKPANVTEDRLLTSLRERDPEVSEPGELDDLKAELTGLAQEHLATPDVEIADVRFERGTIEVVAILVTTATIVKEFGALAQGLRSLADAIPAPVHRYVSRHLQRLAVAGASVAMPGDPAIELRRGIIEAPTSLANGWPQQREAPDAGARAPEGSSAWSRPEARVPRWAFVYLAVSHGVLTLALALMATVVVLERL